jgi:hypothetical protein
MKKFQVTKRCGARAPVADRYDERDLPLALKSVGVWARSGCTVTLSPVGAGLGRARTQSRKRGR